MWTLKKDVTYALALKSLKNPNGIERPMSGDNLLSCFTIAHRKNNLRK